ncbi:MAG: oxaloacetate decarboxylase [Armatimonadota bacterium]|nr:oxaloacetate decarboxylase [Armatimonadota bacterium]MDR5702060.1 oxaloacetate decarboxylase [Armatimonadota bacterium]
MGPGRKLREMLKQPGAYIMPGAPNALTARIIEEAGFKVVLFTGAGFANMELAVPDLGLTTMTEVVQQVGRICEAVEIPVVADADTGYGNPLNVRRTVRELERAGAAAIIIEDQTWPKRCGHFEGKEVIDREDMIAKIKAAVDARRDPDTVIIARTDARAVFGLQEAIERARSYAEAGADATFIEAPQSVEELELIPKSIPVPQMANMVEGGKTPILPFRQLEAMGFKLIAYANAALRAAIKGMQIVLSGLARDGTTENVLDHMVTWEERQRLVRLREYNELEMQYTTMVSRKSK